MSFADASKAMAQYKEWMIGANKTQAADEFVWPKSSWSDSASKNYNLKGSAIRKFLQYEEQGTWQGINLGWTDNASADTATRRSRWFFSKPSGKDVFDGAVLYGEPIAMAWGSKKDPFVKYATRRVGINLDWSNKPVYEWAILGVTPGTKVKRGGDWVILYNLKRKRPLIYFDRTKGGDIGWPRSEVWARGAIANANKDVSMEDVVKPLLMPGVARF